MEIREGESNCHWSVRRKGSVHLSGNIFFTPWTFQFLGRCSLNAPGEHKKGKSELKGKEEWRSFPSRRGSPSPSRSLRLPVSSPPLTGKVVREEEKNPLKSLNGEKRGKKKSLHFHVCFVSAASKCLLPSCHFFWFLLLLKSKQVNHLLLLDFCAYLINCYFVLFCTDQVHRFLSSILQKFFWLIQKAKEKIPTKITSKEFLNPKHKKQNRKEGTIKKIFNELLLLISDHSLLRSENLKGRKERNFVIGNLITSKRKTSKSLLQFPFLNTKHPFLYLVFYINDLIIIIILLCVLLN